VAYSASSSNYIKDAAMNHHDVAIQTAALTGAGVSYIQLGGSYWTLAIVGLLIGLVRWFSAYAGSDPQWDKKKRASEAVKSALFGLVVMPAAIDMSTPTLQKYGICTPATEILVGVVASFFAVELFSIGLKFISRKAGS